MAVSELAGQTEWRKTLSQQQDKTLSQQQDPLHQGQAKIAQEHKLGAGGREVQEGGGGARCQDSGQAGDSDMEAAHDAHDGTLAKFTQRWKLEAEKMSTLAQSSIAAQVCLCLCHCVCICVHMCADAVLTRCRCGCGKNKTQLL